MISIAYCHICKTLMTTAHSTRRTIELFSTARSRLQGVVTVDGLAPSGGNAIFAATERRLRSLPIAVQLHALPVKD